MGSFLDHVLRSAPCDVYIKRITHTTSAIDSILVPVAGGPHDELAAALAGRLARQHDATVHLYHVTEQVGDSNDSEALFENRRVAIGPEVSVTQEHVRSEQVSDTITEEATNHDLTILGATLDPFLKRRLVGSVAQSVGRAADSGVIVTRQHMDDTEE